MTMATRRLLPGLFIATSLGLVACGGGGGGTPAVSSGSSAIFLYQNEHVGAVVDSNGGHYSHVIAKQLQAVGGAPLSGYTWTVATGTSLPYPGLIIDPLTGAVHGTPPAGFAVGTYPFSVTVSDGTISKTGPVNLVVTACNSAGTTGDIPSNCGIPSVLDVGTGSIWTMLGGSPTAGKGYGYSLWVLGGTPPYQNWAVTSGSLPPGLSLDQSRGVGRGTPLSNTAGQTYTFTVSAADSAGQVSPNASQSQATYKLTIGG